MTAIPIPHGQVLVHERDGVAHVEIRPGFGYRLGVLGATKEGGSVSQAARVQLYPDMEQRWRDMEACHAERGARRFGATQARRMGKRLDEALARGA